MVHQSAVVAVGLAWTSVAHAATFYVDPSTGDDSRTLVAAQSSTTPWRTLGRALTTPQITSGDTIRLAAGDYGAYEPFPLPVRDGVAVVGAGPGSSVITVPAGRNAAFRATTSLDASTRFEGIGLMYGGTIGDPADALQFEGSSLTLSPTIDDVSIDGPFRHGLAVSITHGSLGARITNTTITGVNQGILVDARDTDVTMQVSDSVISAADTGIHVEGHDGDFTFAPVVSGSTVFANGRAAVYVAVSSASSVAFAPRILGNELSAESRSGATGLHGQVQWIEALTDRTVIGGNVIRAADTGIFWWLLDFNTGAGTTDIDSHVEANTVSSAATGITTGLNRMRGHGGRWTQQVSGNDVTAGGLGVYAFGGLYQSDIIGTSLVAGNSIAASGTARDYGVVQSLSASSNAQPQSLQFSDNVVHSQADAAAVLYDYAIGPAGIVSGNTIVGNPGAGLVLWANSLDSGYRASDVGQGERGSPGYNTLMGNGRAEGPFRDFDLVNLTHHPVSARNNAWGATYGGLIEPRISDDDESGDQGAVDFSDALCDTPSPAPRVSTDIAVIIDHEPPGLSPGDTVRISATLAPMGDIGCASATIGISDEIQCAAYVRGSVESAAGYARATSAGAPPNVALGWIPAASAASASWDARVRDVPDCGAVTATIRATCAPGNDVVSIAAAEPPADAADELGDSATSAVDEYADETAGWQPARECPLCRPGGPGPCGCANTELGGSSAPWLILGALFARRRGAPPTPVRSSAIRSRPGAT